MKWDLGGAGWIFSLKFFATGTKEDQRDVCRSLKWKITECIKTFCLPKLVRLMGDHFRRQRMEEKRGCKSEKNKIVKLFVQIYFLLLLTKATKITIGWSGLVRNCLFSRLFLLKTLGSPIIVITTTTIIKIIRQLGFLSAESIAKSVELADPPYQPQPTHHQLKSI